MILEIIFVYVIGYCKRNLVLIIMVFYCLFDLILFYWFVVIIVNLCFVCICGYCLLDEVNKLDYFIVIVRDIIIKNCERLIINLDDRVRE